MQYQKTLLFSCGFLTFTAHTMDLRDSVELEILDLENPQEKNPLLKQLKITVVDGDTDKTKQLLNTVLELESYKEKSKIFTKFDYWLHHQIYRIRTPIKSTLSSHNTAIFHNIMSKLMFVCGTILLFKSSPTTALFSYGTGIFLLFPWIFYTIKSHYASQKALSIAISNREVYYAQRFVQKRIKKLQRFKKKAKKEKLTNK